MVEKDFLRTLAALKSHDPKIYDTSVKFFDAKRRYSLVDLREVLVSEHN